jgi:hypothetical protein
VLNCLPFAIQIRLVIVVTFATGTILYADDKPTAPEGYKLVPVTGNGKTSYVAVKDDSNPYQHVASSDSTDKYDPTRIDFSATSPMANKQFLPTSNSLAKSDFANNGDEKTFLTKSYAEDTSTLADHSTPNLDAKFATSEASGYTRKTSEFDRSFATSSDTDQNKAATIGAGTASEQDRTAAFASQTYATSASSLSDKTFRGPEADAAHRHLTQLDNGQMYVTDLPDRPLTIDEVRELINHGFKPDTSVKPPPPSKPLNDPNYQPEPSPQAPAPDQENDKDDPVPPPGMMATPTPVPTPAPEDSEPLPQR